MDTLLQDLRFGARLLWKQKTLSVAAIATPSVAAASPFPKERSPSMECCHANDAELR